MITKWAIYIANQLIKVSRKKTNSEQLDIYIYGLECFLNTFITITLLTIWGIFSHSLSSTLLWVLTFSLLRHFIGGVHAPTQLTCILASFFLGCINKWSTAFITQNTCLYVLLAFMCLLFAPTSNNKVSLSSTQKKLHKIISILIIFTGLLIFYKIGHSNLTATIFYSFLCAIILMLIETILHLRINLIH